MPSLNETMIIIYISIAVLATTALAKGSGECIFSESSATCFGATGQLLIFHLSYKRGTSIVITKDDKHRILKISNQGKVTLDKEYVNQSDSIDTVILKVGEATKKHSGHYQLEEHDHDGKLLKKINVYLKIQAPVSKPGLSQKCLSSEQMKVSCFSEGDGVQFILNLDGQILTQSNDHNQSLNISTSQFSYLTVDLHGKLNGNLSCQVWNNISRNETVIHLAACKDSVTTLTVIATVITLFIVVALSLAVKQFCEKTRPTTVDEDDVDSDIIYRDVKVTNDNKLNKINSGESAGIGSSTELDSEVDQP
ncbi:uncharacterized protein LOC109203890 [Oreochromis niloticus]|uniref:uncharacterized protein LOC109203890 n=1 Tax=Oreochromis niloticus TaxID=8128 RepID=UPI000905BD1C|nr:uncharacterized protein LOC109203890 [Oreochromis niloticus]CAI5642995.1 unnamed protein product [Mustela putorius furo]